MRIYAVLLVRYCVVLYARLRECVYHHAAYIIHSFSLAGGGQPVPAFLPPEPPPFPVPSRVHHSWLFPADYSACVQPIASASLAAYCSASSARAEFLQHVRRPLSGGSLRPACALGGNRLADSFQATLICSSKNNRRQAENIPTSRLSGVQPDKRRNCQPTTESGALLHSRAGFAEESARGSVSAEATPGQGVLTRLLVTA